MPVAQVNLLNIPYQWGGKNPATGLDCFSLASFYRQQFGRSPLPDHDWVYRLYSESQFPPQEMIRLLTQCYGRGEARPPQPFDLIALLGETVCLGTAIKKEGGGLMVLHFSSNRFSRITDLDLLARRRAIGGVWNPDQEKTLDI